MDAAQDLLMQYRGFAAFNCVFIRFASQGTPLRAGFHDAPIYAGFQSKEHRMHRDGKCDRRLNAFSFIVAETRFVTTVARPPSISTSNLVETRGMGRRASTVNAPAIKAPRGSIVRGVAIVGMGGLLEEVGKKVLNAFDNRLDRCARGQKLGINNKRDSRCDRKWGTFARLKEKFDSCRREAEIT